MARSAASRATAGSMILRTSNMPRRNSGSRPASDSQASTSGSSSRHSDRGRTTVPRLDRDSTRPFAARTLVASRITVRLTPSMRLSSPCSGRISPAASSPRTIRRPMPWTTPAWIPAGCGAIASNPVDRYILLYVTSAEARRPLVRPCARATRPAVSTNASLVVDSGGSTLVQCLPMGMARSTKAPTARLGFRPVTSGSVPDPRVRFGGRPRRAGLTEGRMGAIRQ